MRQICVEITRSFVGRNIDADLLREHSVRRYCAHYKGLQIFANSTHASTHAAILRKKNIKKIAFEKKSKKKSEPRLELGISNLESATLTTRLPGLPLEEMKWICYINTAAQFRRNICACVDACAKIAQNSCFFFCKVNVLNFFVNPPQASTYTSNLQKKKPSKFFCRIRRIFKIFFCANLPHTSTHASNVRNYFFCAIAPIAQKMAQICNFAPFKITILRLV